VLAAPGCAFACGQSELATVAPGAGCDAPIITAPDRTTTQAPASTLHRRPSSPAYLDTGQGYRADRVRSASRQLAGTVREDGPDRPLPPRGPPAMAVGANDLAFGDLSRSRRRFCRDRAFLVDLAIIGVVHAPVLRAARATVRAPRAPTPPPDEVRNRAFLPAPATALDGDM
jgi:hypothetical protein